LGEWLVYKLKVLLGYQKSWTQKACKHLKKRRIKGNKALYEGGKRRFAS
jgi:hypothetical protein